MTTVQDPMATYLRQYFTSHDGTVALRDEQERTGELASEMLQHVQSILSASTSLRSCGTPSIPTPLGPSVPPTLARFGVAFAFPSGQPSQLPEAAKKRMREFREDHDLIADLVRIVPLRECKDLSAQDAKNGFAV